MTNISNFCRTKYENNQLRDFFFEQANTKAIALIKQMLKKLQQYSMI